ncbi:MAG: mercuric reductase [Candidatus Melainabacteria bacterium HGW-Melainabacteria-1]|nr:MAG: mercuric reductase [Candidatus Melainabacteria bacterium HGW-Melainabacteria-1]
MSALNIAPLDQHNLELLANVHPDHWQNPSPEGTYNLVVIGAGTAGLVTAAGAAGLGAKVALIERHLMGGDCLNVGCVPSKAVIRAARAAEDVRKSPLFGIHSRIDEIDFAKSMQRMRQIRAHISRHDSFERFKNLGVDVYLGSGEFISGNEIQVNGQILRFKKAVIASGARAAIPDIPGLKEAGFLTNENVFNLTELPRRLACIGGGPIGCELAQAFQRLGAQVSLFHNGPHLLNREDADAAAIVQQQFVAEGIQLVLNVSFDRVEIQGSDKILHYHAAGQAGQMAVDEILLGAGRAPNVEGLGLEKVGVVYNRQGIQVNDQLQTTHPAIYAAGDVCMAWKFTHAADFAARTVLQNSLFMGRKKLSALLMPWCTYTDPEIAHVGLYEHEAQAQQLEIDTYIKHFRDVDRALADGEEAGFVKIHTLKGKDKILGATIGARHAGEMLGELTLAIQHGIGLGKIASVIHPYPTQAEAIRHLGDQYKRTKLTPTVKNLFQAWLKWQRGK